MYYDSTKLPLKKRRGISNIIGSLIVLAVVASVGSVILIQGLNQINAFNYDLTLFDKDRVNEIREDLIFEHVRFNPDNNELELYIANIGSIDAVISSVTVVKIDSQDLILRNGTVNQPILIEDHEKLTLLGDLSEATPTPDVWNSPEYNSSNYKITVGTSKGNFFSTVAEPFYT